MYNVRFKEFENSVQLQVFDNPIRENFDDRKVNPITGEILGTGKIIINPFTNELDVVRKIGSPDDNLKRSHRRTVNKIYDIARSNSWDYFFTLTFNPQVIDSYSYTECAKKLSVWFNNMRKSCPDMVYLVVPEQHKSGRWHFHGLFANVDNMDFIDTGKYSKGKKIYNVGNYKFGFSTATHIDDVEKTVSYISKYITKELCDVTKGKKRYWCSRNVKTPVIKTACMGLSLRRLVLEFMDNVQAHIKTVHTAVGSIRYFDMPKGSFDIDSLLEFEIQDRGVKDSDLMYSF